MLKSLFDYVAGNRLVRRLGYEAERAWRPVRASMLETRHNQLEFNRRLEDMVARHGTTEVEKTLAEHGLEHVIYKMN